MYPKDGDCVTNMEAMDVAAVLEEKPSTREKFATTMSLAMKGLFGVPVFESTMTPRYANSMETKVDQSNIFRLNEIFFIM